MVMIATRAQKRSAVVPALLQLEAQHIGIEMDCAIKVSDLEMDMANFCLRVNRV
jgi:hypothetical protein